MRYDLIKGGNLLKELLPLNFRLLLSGFFLDIELIVLHLHLRESFM
jgi:hypothetical protein